MYKERDAYRATARLCPVVTLHATESVLLLAMRRDAIHFWLFAGTLIGLLPSSILTIEGSCNTRDCWYHQPYRVDTEIAT